MIVKVCCKVPHPGMFDSPYRINRFHREAKSAAQLWHPNIVPVLNSGKVGDHYYIALPSWGPTVTVSVMAIAVRRQFESNLEYC